MATLKQLYQLVHSLDKAEKKHVSILADALGGKARTRYTNAIRIINKQKEFDAIKLKKKLSADITGMSLSEANDYIFHFICKALVSHSSPSGANLGLLKEMILVETLVNKGLFEIAEKYLTPLLVRLQNGNSFGLLTRGLELKSIITASKQQSKPDYEARLQILNERTKTAQENLLFLEIMRMNNRIYELAHSIGEPRETAHLQRYENIYRSPVWQIPYTDVSNQVFIMFAPLKVDLTNMVLGSDAAVNEGLKALKEFRSRFKLSGHYVLAFYLLDSTISDCIRSRNEKAMLPLLKELRDLLPYAKQHAVAQKIQAKLMYAELVLHIFNKTYSKGIEELQQWMKRKETWYHAPLGYINLLMGARLYYLHHLPEKALDYLNLMRPFEKEMRESILLAYRFLHLLCYSQLDNPSLVYSAARSIYKSLLKQEKLYTPERAILRFAKASGTIEKMRKNIQELYTTLNQLQHDPYHIPFFLFADYMEWVSAELKQKKLR